MKRNRLPESHEQLLDEQAIIDQRLKALFSDEIHRLPIRCKGQWLPESQHVKLDSIRGIPTYMIKFHTYHYLNGFEALYCLESGKLVIIHNEYPLSLIEAYQLLSDDLKLYSVYQQIIRAGHVCHRLGSDLRVRTKANETCLIVVRNRSDGLPVQSVIDSVEDTIYALVDEDNSVCFVQFQDFDAKTMIPQTSTEDT